MFEWLIDPHAWMALATLTILEIILGIDNIIFLALVVSKLPPISKMQHAERGYSQQCSCV